MRMKYAFTHDGALVVAVHDKGLTHLSGYKLTTIPRKFAAKVFGNGFTKFVRVAAVYKGYFIGTHRKRRNVADRFSDWKKGIGR